MGPLVDNVQRDNDSDDSAGENKILEIKKRGKNHLAKACT